MKKLQFKLDGKQMLSRNEMKSISGGSGRCYVTCCYGGPGTCNPDYEPINSSCSTYEDCQDIGIALGYECTEGYLAGFCEH